MGTHVSFDIGLADAIAVNAIVDRAVDFYRRKDIKVDRLDLAMDITAVHMNGTPLKLVELAQADEFNFLHDINGIRRHIDRNTGRLTNCFLPRFAQ